MGEPDSKTVRIHPLAQLASVPLLLLLRRQLCDSVLAPDSTSYDITCNDNFLKYLLELLAPWKAIFSINPMGGWGTAYDAQLVLLCAFFLAFLVGMLQFLSPRYTQAYISPAHGIVELALRLVSMFIRSCYGIVYLYLYWQHYHGFHADAPARTESFTHKLAMQAICSHYAIRGLEALLLRRYSSPFFPPTLPTIAQLLCTLAAYLFHYFVVIAHFYFASRADYGPNEEYIHTPFMYFGYCLAVVGQIRLLKNADLLPGCSGIGSFKGDVMSWIGISMITQHGGIWMIALALIPFAHCEQLLEIWTGQRYGLVCSPLRTRRAVFLKDVPGLATEVIGPIAEKSREWGQLESVVVRPRTTTESSDVYMVFSETSAAGMASSSLDGTNVAGWRVNATQRVV